MHAHPERAAGGARLVSRLEVGQVRPLQARDPSVVTPEHVGGRAEQLEVLGVERRRLVGPRKRVVRVSPGPSCVRPATLLEVVPHAGIVTHRAAHSPGAAAAPRRRAARIPTAISTPPSQLEQPERLGQEHDGDRGREERLQVRGERRARRPDPVERAEPEMFVRTSGPRVAKTRSPQISQPSAQSCVSSCAAPVIVMGTQARDEHDARDAGGGVRPHQRRHEHRVRRPGRRREDPEEHAAEVAGELAAGAERDERDAGERERAPRPRSAGRASRCGARGPRTRRRPASRRGSGRARRP